MTAQKICVVYHYYEKNETYADNLVYFLARAWRRDITFFIIIAGECSRNIPEVENVHIIKTQNYGHDFGGYSELAHSGALDEFDRMIFANSSARGPFLPYYAKMNWTKALLDLLQCDTHLSGITINILHADRPISKAFREHSPNCPIPHSHVQSYTFALTSECFRYLKELGFFDNTIYLSKMDAILKREIEMSIAVRRRGWNIACLLPPYNSIDYRYSHRDINPSTQTGHPLKRGAYFGATPHPYELLFVKTEWDLLSDASLAFHSLMNMQFHPMKGLDWDEAQEFSRRLEERLAQDKRSSD